jgi:uncharacterized protein YdhG (YjbR/CyaY superfamily)
MTGSSPPKGSGSASGAPGNEQVDVYIAAVESPQRETLKALRETLRSILPHAEEAMKYGLPAFTLGGKGVAGYAAFKDHCSYFPMSGTVLDAAGDAVARYQPSKGGIQFGVDERLPIGLLRLLVKLRIEEISDVHDGRRYEFYADGQVKASGQMKDGRLHGRWEWFRRDGSLMRTGQFTNGAQVGTWTTWKQDGTTAKITEF